RRRKSGTHYLWSDPGRTAPSIWPDVIYGRHSFYMLLYVFLTRRYRHVEIVFIRYTNRAEEVDENTFIHGPASGGTLVSSARCTRSSGRGFAPLTGTSTPPRPPRPLPMEHPGKRLSRLL